MTRVRPKPANAHLSVWSRARRTVLAAADDLLDEARSWLRSHPRLRRASMPLIRPLLRPLVDFVARNHIGYHDWLVANGVLSQADRSAIAEHIAALGDRPLISVVMPVYNTSDRLLREAIASVRGQLWPHWELCIADDASPAPHVAQILREAVASDPRIRVVYRPVNGHISAASNSALELATGAWIALMDHDDLLPETALYELAAEVAAHPDAAVIYSDEDKVDARGRRSEPNFKPDFDPDLLLGQNMVSHLGAYRRDLLEQIGGFREGFEGSQDHDLALRATRACGPSRVRHIPLVLYHWRQLAGAASFSETQLARCIDASARAILEHLDASGVQGATIEPARLTPVFNRVVFPMPSPAPRVSVVIPTRDGADLLSGCLEGLFERTDYPALEVVVADNGSEQPETFALFERYASEARFRVLPLPGPFNFSRLNNQAIAQTTGEIVLMLNNDIAMIGADWLRELVSHAVRPEIGAVGARLLYADGTVQHGGVVLGVGYPDGVAGHFARHAHRQDPGRCGSLSLTRTVSAVTAACLAIRRTTFDEVGGLDEANLAVAFNDVDFCLRVREAGYRNLIAPAAELYHLESATRGDDMDAANYGRFVREVRWMRARWGAALDQDPYWNPNLSLARLDDTLATPPRRVPTWRRMQAGAVPAPEAFSA